jgi:tetratricopeptide (TPR) repeat protein
MKYILACIYIFFGTLVHGQYSFQWDDRIQQINDAVTSMRIPEAKRLIQSERKIHPKNLCLDLLESHADLYELFFNESKEVFKTAYPMFSARIEKFEKAPQNSPYRDYGLGVLYLSKAAVAIRFEKNLEAAWAFRKAYFYFKDNKKNFPQFSPNDVYYGLLTTLLGSVPNNYQWLLNIIGMPGDINRGIAVVHKYIHSRDANNKVARNVAMLVYPYLVVIFEGNKNKALAFLEKADYDFKYNHLHAYMATNLYLGNQQAKRSLEIAEGIVKSDAYSEVAFWHFEKGYGLLNQLKFDQSEKEFLQFVDQFKGSFYLKDAYEKLSWIAYLRGDQKKASEYRSQVLQRGSLVTDADKMSMRNAQSATWPHPLLLRARLLSDGGMFKESIEVFKGMSTDDFQSAADKAEFVYRLARNYDLIGDKELAIKYYNAAIAFGSNVRDYFAARSALQTALIYEERKDYVKASYYFKTAISMKDYPFKNSIDQKAKSGVYRSSMASTAVNGKKLTD